MSNDVHLEVSEAWRDGKVRLTTRVRPERGGEQIEIFHEFDAPRLLSQGRLLDGHVLALLIHVMQQNRRLVVHGPMSRAMLRNLDELQLVWSRWRPGRYFRVEILPDSIVEAGPSKDDRSAIAAFSGGADATFTALRHTRLQPPHLRYNLTSVLMVHGFDVDLANVTQFDRLVDRVSPLLTELGLGLKTIRTNSKDWKRQHWNDSFALELAACLHMVSGDFRYGLIGSSEPYEALVLPRGSTPVTDHLMSGAGLSIVHDGAGFARTDKIDAIARHATACRTLKVCWAGADQSDNCGRCEKCVRTMLNFLAAGRPPPPAFPDGLDLRDIGRMKIYNEAQLAELNGILRHAKEHGTSGPWLSALQRRVHGGLSI